MLQFIGQYGFQTCFFNKKNLMKYTCTSLDIKIIAY